MKFKKMNFILLIFGGVALGNLGCGKEFLEAKPNTNLLLLKSLEDYQLLLSNTTVLNQTGSLPLAASDEYEVFDYNTYLAFEQQTTKNAYIWAKDLYGGDLRIDDWNIPYSAIFYANCVIEELPNNDQIGTANWNKTKGWAHFARAFAYFDLVQNFSKAYHPSTANKDLGLPLRQKPGIDELLQRATLKETYELILADLELAATLLPNLAINSREQPSKAAAFALFARVYLSMGNYAKAEQYAELCLAIYNKLIDYNSLSTTISNPFTFNNEENIYLATQINSYNEVTTTATGKYTIAKSLLDLYEPNDLRRTIYFTNHANGSIILKRGYSGRTNIFTGLATDEVYLIKAECAARREALPEALSYLNNLLLKRYKTGTFVPKTADNAAELLELILIERRKELVRRGLRWSDLKRLNRDGANIVLTRTLNGTTYTLPPNDPRYIFPIPLQEINFSNIEQNIR